MGSGYVMNSFAFRALAHLTSAEYKKAVESLGADFLIDNFGDQGFEDFVTTSKKGAGWVRIAVEREMIASARLWSMFSVDVREMSNGTFMVSFFK